MTIQVNVKFHRKCATPAPCSFLQTVMSLRPAYDTCLKTNITAHISPLPPQTPKRCSFLVRRFSLTASENYFIMKDDEESCLWFPAAPWWLFLEQSLRPESFRKWSTFFSVKYVMPSWDPFTLCLRQIYIHSFIKEHINYIISLFSTEPELTRAV